MSQEFLEQALQLLSSLEGQLDGELRSQVTAARNAVAQAQQRGEGQDADALREQIEANKVENSEFVSVMVHEIRKPMTSIRGYADMLGKNVMGELNEMQTQFVETIRNNIISMEQLVTDISDISKMHSGRMMPQPKMEMFKNVVMKLEKDFGEIAEQRGIPLVFDIPQGLPLLNLDGTRLEQALKKLLDNALKYTHDGGGEVRLTAEGLGDKLRVTIRDHGVGISQSDQRHLGELFFRGDQELVTQTKGYGMGLPIVMGCMALIDGELRWESTEGEGSTFEVIIPAMS
jgi:signal transduction histidine kinase